jgi:hypothetical protein
MWARATRRVQTGVNPRVWAAGVIAGFLLLLGWEPAVALATGSGLASLMKGA